MWWIQEDSKIIQKNPDNLDSNQTTSLIQKTKGSFIFFVLQSIDKKANRQFFFISMCLQMKGLSGNSLQLGSGLGILLPKSVYDMMWSSFISETTQQTR